PSSPGSPISSEKISPKISIPDSLEIVSIGLVSTFVSTNKTGGGVSSKNDNNDLICSGEPFSSVSIAQIYPSFKPYRSAKYWYARSLVTKIRFSSGISSIRVLYCSSKSINCSK